MRDRLIVIHFGAHRTGTTYLQAVFSNNAELLAERGIQYRCLFDVPSVRKAIIASRRAATRGDEAEFERHFAVVENYLRTLLKDHPTDDLLISYEGILGGLAAAEDNKFYPHHQRCLTQFLRIFAGERVHGVFAIREYGSFIESSYKKLVESGHKPKLECTSAGNVSDDVSWLPIVRALKSAFGSQFSLFSYEDFAKCERRCLKWLLQRTFNLDVDLLELIEKPLNPSPSRPALRAMLLVNRMLPRSARPLRQRINRRLSSWFPADKYGHPKLLGADVKRALKERYAIDLQTLRQELPNMYGPV